MRVTIVSQGPSVKDFHEDCHMVDQTDIVIGVNSVVERTPCDWWVMVDARPFTQYTPIGRPWIFTRRDYVDADFGACRENALWKKFCWWPRFNGEHLQDLIPRCADRTVMCYDVFLPGYGPQPGTLPVWNTLGGLSALGLAYLYRPKVLTLRGYDMAGTDGANTPAEGEKQNRSEKRWEFEHQMFAWWTAQFVALGTHFDMKMPAADGKRAL